MSDSEQVLYDFFYILVHAGVIQPQRLMTAD